MQYVNLGKSGLKVSRLCLGMMSYGTSKWRPWVLDETDSRPFLKKALEAGIAIMPGHLFSAADRYHDFIRLSAAFWSPEVENAVRRLGRIAAQAMEGRSPG